MAENYLPLIDRRPLAERLRPATLEEVAGQKHLRTRLRTYLQAPRLPSLLLFGPPGCGKSSLALLLAAASNASQGRSYVRVSAPEAGLAELRKKLQGVHVLVLDELHRFSKAQQDFFLPLLETGEVTLIATTTENPSFSVTRQLLSRLHVLKLQPLDREALLQVARRACGVLEITLEEDTLAFLATASHGDARSLLNLLEHAASLPPEHRTLEALKERLPELMLRHDKAGDSHYELASALIKSIRGSDPDAAVYYLACLLTGGEDPRFVCRRLILSASEDVGLADPQALPLAVACLQAVESIGMPEGFIPMAETAVYLALAPKSNSTYLAYHAAAAHLKKHGLAPVPLHLRNAATALQKEWGFGKEYKYPHNFPGAWVEQQYLPDAVAGTRFYHAKDQGLEPVLNGWEPVAPEQIAQREQAEGVDPSGQREPADSPGSTDAADSASPPDQSAQPVQSAQSEKPGTPPE
ncbi:replication-associated recombination protein A [Megalodesulfovibrio paquesii]